VRRLIYVVGVDPGRSTGVSIMHNHELCDRWQEAWQDAVQRLRSFITDKRATEPEAVIIIAVERFISTGHHGPRSHQPTALQAVGAVEGIAFDLDVELVWQSPADAKKLMSNARLRAWGLLATGRDVNQRDANDANDATRHALLLLARRFAVDFERLLNAEH
jgi:hypothetical protein